MKFSKETIDILKNFAQINPNIYFRKGNVIDTISTYKSIYAKARIQEEIPMDFAVYDLNSLLGMLSLVMDQDIVFGNNSLVTTSNKGTFEYFYSNPELITIPPTGGIKHSEVFSFEMSSDDITLLLKAASITSSPTIAIECSGENVVLSTVDREDSTSNTYRKKLGEFDMPFSLYIDVKNLKIINDNPYIFSVAKIDSPSKTVPLLHLRNVNRELEYWVASEVGSNV